eukprot:1194444-Prorocentrum_minimum.AAC.2
MRAVASLCAPLTSESRRVLRRPVSTLEMEASTPLYRTGRTCSSSNTMCAPQGRTELHFFCLCTLFYLRTNARAAVCTDAPLTCALACPPRAENRRNVRRGLQPASPRLASSPALRLLNLFPARLALPKGPNVHASRLDAARPPPDRHRGRLRGGVAGGGGAHLVVPPGRQGLTEMPAIGQGMLNINAQHDRFGAPPHPLAPRGCESHRRSSDSVNRVVNRVGRLT